MTAVVSSSVGSFSVAEAGQYELLQVNVRSNSVITASEFNSIPGAR